MCLCAYKPKSKTILISRLKSAHDANPDGWGLIWPWGSMRSCDGFNAFLEAYYEHAEDDLVIHFRTASSGAIGVENCHPFFVNVDLAFVENGNLYEYADFFKFGRFDGKTDIRRFNDEVLKLLPKWFIYDPEIRKALEAYCKSNMTKMIFMDAAGGVSIVNEESGEWVDGVWYSNGGIDNYTGYGYSGAYYYSPWDVRHKGGLISVQQFAESERTKWSKCPSCLGWYYEINGFCEGCKIWHELLKWRV